MSELLSDVGKKILREHVDRQNEPLNEAKVVDKFDIEDTEKQQFSHETLKELGITTSKNREVDTALMLCQLFSLPTKNH